jgi:hypothetical protein
MGKADKGKRCKAAWVSVAVTQIIPSPPRANQNAARGVVATAKLKVGERLCMSSRNKASKTSKPPNKRKLPATSIRNTPSAKLTRGV